MHMQSLYRYMCTYMCTVRTRELRTSGKLMPLSPMPHWEMAAGVACTGEY